MPVSRAYILRDTERQGRERTPEKPKFGDPAVKLGLTQRQGVAFIIDGLYAERVDVSTVAVHIAERPSLVAETRACMTAAAERTLELVHERGGRGGRCQGSDENEGRQSRADNDGIADLQRPV